MLNFAEKLMLIALDDETGHFIHSSFASFDYAMVGALLMDLELTNRLDTDLHSLIIVNQESTGDPLLDYILDLISKEPNTKNPLNWIKIIKNQIPDLNEVIIDRLIKHGAIQKKENRFLGLFKTCSYPKLDDTEENEIKSHLRCVIQQDDIPDPRDIVLISLLSSCDMLNCILSEVECKQYEARITCLANMELIGQAVNNAIQELHKQIITAFLV